jgi:hypothetical protein
MKRRRSISKGRGMFADFDGKEKDKSKEQGLLDRGSRV